MSAGICSQEGRCRLQEAINKHCEWCDNKIMPTECSRSRCVFYPFSPYAPENQEEPQQMKCGGG